MEAPAEKALVAVVGIGASAGGLDALRDFFTAMPGDAGIAFVVVQHLDPHHESMLAQILTQFTKMKVIQVEENVVLGPNQVYLIPPGRYLALAHGRLHLTAPEPHRMPIDFFFHSLAEDQREKAICVVLSGTGSDGTLGAQTINCAGGAVFVQEPASAKFDGMPRSVAQSGYADFVLPVERLVPQLVSYTRDYFHTKPLSPEVTAGKGDMLLMIVSLIRSRTGHDFALYKKNMLHRRVLRRMSLAGIDDLGLYYRYLQENPDEVKRLFRETLVLVSSFFRDPDAFDVLKTNILPILLAEKLDDYELRIWVPACARGEEAYSIAMVIHEYADVQKRRLRLQIFGTDVDEQAVAYARTGLYPEGIAADISPERLDRFFMKEENGYRIESTLREHMVFAVHDLIKAAPFARLDLVSCRNVLIYFEPELQEQLIRLFRYALRPGGVLLLGTSETIGTHADLFAPLDQKQKFFQAKGTGGVGVGQIQRLPDFRTGLRQIRPVELPKSVDPASFVHRLVMERFGPPSVLTDEKGTILYFYGNTARYLSHPSGSPTSKVFNLAQEGIASALDAAYRLALSENREVVREGAPFKGDEGSSHVTLVVRPIPQQEGPTLVLATFLEAPADRERKRDGETVPAQGSAATEALERELKYTRESLQASIEHLQHSNEDLRLANEELQSMNQQREVSKEELQSMNEELSSVNAELHLRVEQLAQTEHVLENLLDNTNVGTIYLDSNLKVVRFTAQAAKVVRLVATDVGRPIADMAVNLENEHLVDDTRRVMETLAFEEKEVRSKDGTWYLMGIMPLRSVDQPKGGVVITFSDVTLVKELTEQRIAREYAEGIVETVREPLVVLDVDLRVVSANEAFYRTFKVSERETKGRYLYDVGNRQWAIPSLKKLLEEVLSEKRAFQDFRVEHEIPSVGHRVMLLNARAIAHGREPVHVLLTIEDITEREKDVQTSGGETK
jgi:two-component system, chemotaxis family, CheB/CheR fusion protein